VALSVSIPYRVATNSTIEGSFPKYEAGFNPL